MIYLLLVLSSSVDPPRPYGPTPKPGHIKYYREELSGYLHFGVDTFTEVQWGSGHEDPNLFNPSALNTTQWIEVFKKAGFKRVLIIAKHHDGMCYWRSKLTRHQINESWDFQETSKRLGQSGDLLEEVSKSCTALGMQMGLYLSPWDMNSSYYGKDDAYNEYYMGHLKEILGNPKYGNNGRWEEVWMDAAKGWGPGQKYYFLKWFDLIEQLQPGAIVTSAYASGVRTPGNERAEIGNPNWHLVNESRHRDEVDRGIYNVNDLYMGDRSGDQWNMPECDMTISWGWFFDNRTVPKSMERLMLGYFTSVARSCPYLVNIPPNKKGLLPEDCSNRLIEFGDQIRKTFAHDFTQDPGVRATASSVRGGSDKYSAANVLSPDTETYWAGNDGENDGWVEIDLGQERTFDIISISEHIALGQRVLNFSCEVWTKGVWRALAVEVTIGAKRLLRCYPTTASKLRLAFTAMAVPCIEKIGVFKADGYVGLEKLPLLGGMWTVPYSDVADLAGSWVSTEESWTATGTGCSLIFKFVGSTFWILGNKDPSYGDMKIYIDMKYVAQASCYASTHQTKVILFRYDTLDHGRKRIDIRQVGVKPIAINSLWSLSNRLHGVFELDATSYRVPPASPLTVKIHRTNGSVGGAIVTLQTVPDTALPGVHFQHVRQEVFFNHTENLKEVTIHVQPGSGGLRFHVEIVVPLGNSMIGFNHTAMVEIWSNELESSQEGKSVKNWVILVVGLCGVSVICLIVIWIVKWRREGVDKLVNDELQPSYT
jgi:alpha-L-fucosidase